MQITKNVTAKSLSMSHQRIVTEIAVCTQLETYFDEAGIQINTRGVYNISLRLRMLVIRLLCSLRVPL